MPMLVRLEGVSKSYDGHKALGPVDLELDGDAVGVIGPNGAGKTTLIRMLMGLQPPTEGTVELLGEDVREAGPALRRRIGYVPEGEAAFPGLTGVESVVFAGRLSGLPTATAQKRAHEVLDYVELEEERYRLAQNYSSGMQQRLKLAQALVHDPDLLILDEPTEAVDPETRRHLLTLFREIRKSGIRLLVSTHILPDLEEMVDSAVVLNRGRVVTQGTIEALRAGQLNLFQLRVDGPLEPVGDALSQRDVPWTILGGSIHAEVDHPRVLLAAAAAAGRTVRHLAPVERSLQDAFQDAIALEVEEDE